MWPKNMWKRIPRLMQQHETPRKGYSTIITQVDKSKHNPEKIKPGEHNDWPT